jgi:hypothetical protein
MDPKELLKELKQYTESNTVHMYIIERKKRAGTKTKDRASEKFEYIPLQINLSQELVPIIQGMLNKVIERKVKDDVVIQDYVVIDDTINKIQTYTDFGKIAGFQDFLNKRLNSEIRPIENLEELEDLEKAWALCYGFYDENKKDWLYCIKKLAPRNMTVGIETSQNISEAIKNGVSSLFDLKTKTLKPFNGFSLNIEPSIDMVYYKETIFIFKKKGFEDLTSLTEEFESLANDLVAEVESIGFIEGISHIAKVILEQPAFRNKLIKAEEIGNLEFLKTCKNIKTEFNRAGKKLSIKFRFDKEGKVIAQNAEEAKDIIKVLSEYFKEGIFGGKVFESPAGRLKK